MDRIHAAASRRIIRLELSRTADRMAIWELRKAVVASKGLEGTTKPWARGKTSSFQCAYPRWTSGVVVKGFKERLASQRFMFMGQAEARAQATGA
jgi:hypothetical protein